MKIDLFAKVVLTVLAIGIAFFVLDQDLVKNLAMLLIHLKIYIILYDLEALMVQVNVLLDTW